MTVSLRAGSAELEIDPAAGARWTSWRVAGLELLASAAVPLPAGMSGGSFVMAPFAGRLGGGRLELGGQVHQLPVLAPPHAIHGTVSERPWEVLEQGTDRVRVGVDLGPDWPARGRVEQVLQLTGEQLATELVVTATDPMPVTVGWHPWFARQLTSGAPARWLLEGGQQYVRGADGLPTGELVDRQPGPWDDCFRGFAAAPGLRWDGALELHVDSSADHWVLFDERPGELCLEPQTGPPDAPRLGAATQLAAGESTTLRCAWRWTVLDRPRAR